MFVVDDAGFGAGEGRAGGPDDGCDDEYVDDEAPTGSVVDLDRPPGAWVANQCHVAALVPSLLRDGDVLDVVQGIDLVSRWAAAVRIRMMAEFADRHPAGGSAPPPGGTVASPVDRWLPDEVGMTLRIARLEALAEIARARRFVHVLPDTLASLEAGRIDERRADAIASATALLPDDKARAVEAQVLAKAPDATLKQLRERVRRAIARVDPDGLHRRHKEAVKERTVTIRSLEDGMASLWFYGPAEQIEAAWTMADRLARAPHDPQDERTLDQRRFDLAVQVLQGKLTVTDMGDVRRAVDAALDAARSVDATTPPTGEAPTENVSTENVSTEAVSTEAVSTEAVSTEAGDADADDADTDGAEVGSADTGDGGSDDSSRAGPPHRAPPDGVGARVDRALLTEVVTRVLAARPPLHATVHKPQIQVVVALDTLLGGDRPAELVGHGPITAVTARALAAGGVWERLVTDPLSGRLLDHGRDVYAPPPALAEFVRTRDQICRGPGCTRRIAELDHHIPFGGGHGGTTSEPNFNGYCKHCHMLKDAPGWNAVADRTDPTDRSVTWISPHGRRTTTEPYNYRPFTDPVATGTGTAHDEPAGAGTVTDPSGDAEPPF